MDRIEDIKFLEDFRQKIERYLFLGYAPQETFGVPKEWEEAQKKDEVKQLHREIVKMKRRAQSLLIECKVNYLILSIPPAATRLPQQTFQLFDLVTENNSYQAIDTKSFLDRIDEATSVLESGELRVQSEFPSIFISYKRNEDSDKCEKIAGWLERVYGRTSVWYDTELTGGIQWWSEIVRQIKERDTFLYLLSREALESVYCRFEFSEAWRLKTRIIPIEVRNLSANFLPNEIGKIQIVKIGKDTIGGVLDLFRAITQRNSPDYDLAEIAPESLWAARSIEPDGNTIRVRLRVPADIEPDEEHRSFCNTGILLINDDRISMQATGEITVDNHQTRFNANGTMLNGSNKDQSYYSNETYPVKDNPSPHLGDKGAVGSLFGWIGGRGISEAFFIGEKKQFISQNAGFLYLAVNDTKGAYGDNHGEFDVTVEISHLT